MTEHRGDRESLLNVVERRDGSGRFEFREDKASGQIILEGYAATYDPYDCHGGPNSGGWIEQLSMRAFDDTLSDQPDVQLLINHTGTPLARTKSGTLKLTRDQHGLRVWASLDGSDPDVQALVPKMRRKDMDEMSFAFRVTDQTWDHSYSHRTINALSLEKGDVSIVNYGMNPGTRAVIADAVGALSQLSSKELVELRKLDQGQVKRAVAALQAVAEPRAGGKEPYGDVKYADPGYKTDGKKRYPLDSEGHVRAAWSYINMPKNQKGYTSSQVSSIKGRIKGAAKRFGVAVSDDAGKSKVGISHIDQVVRDGRAMLVAVMTDGSRVPLPSLPQRALPPSDQPQPDADDPGDSFEDQWYGEWDPNDGGDHPADPHDVPYEVGPYGLVNPGPVPDNIMGGGDKFVGQKSTFTQPSPAGDPHDVSFDTEEKLSMDPHEGSLELGPYAGGTKVSPAFGDFEGEGGGGDPHATPYQLGPQVGSVPGDRPNVGGGDPGGKADNVVTSGAALGKGSGCDPGTPPSVGTEEVDEEGEYDWTSGSLEPSDPACELDRGVRSADPHDTPTLGGAGKKFQTGGWEPTNIEGGTVKHDDGEGERVELDLGMAEALERTIVHCYRLAEGNSEVRRTLVVARKQLYTLLGKSPKPAGPTDVQRKMAELRSEVGDPGTGTVAECLKFVRAEGSAPLGYRGLLDQDPSVHVTTPSERLAREALEADRRARDALTDSDKAKDRLRRAQREAELNDAIRRNRNKGE